MSKADDIFKNMCSKILSQGYSSKGQKVRAKWSDGTPAHIIKMFGIVNEYDLSEKFPALTLRAGCSVPGPAHLKTPISPQSATLQFPSFFPHHLP